MLKQFKNNNSVDFSKYKVVFCDSTQALEWAYLNGLSSSAIVKTSSPAMLWGENKYIVNIEKRWSIEELRKFQGSIQKLSEDMFDSALSVKGIERECALSISQVAVIFQKVLYKAACLNDDDFTNPRLFIYVNGKTGPSGNVMNSPWNELLKSNPLFSMINYTLQNDSWSTLSTQGVSYLQRIKVAGYKTIIFRLAIKLMKIIPNCIFKKEILMPNENELNIEIASSLALRGVKVTEIKSNYPPNSDSVDVVLGGYAEDLYKKISPIMYKRVESLVTKSAVDDTMKLFRIYFKSHLKQFKFHVSKWDRSLISSDRSKQVVLMNTPGNIKGQALSYVCRKRNIPFISSQHGVTAEISKLHGEVSVKFESGISDAVLYYNSKCAEVKNSSHFSKSRKYIVGMSSRHMKMRSVGFSNKSPTKIVYVSTNLYRGNIGHLATWNTDYDRAIKEKHIVTEVLDKLPHRVLYKTYPEDNRRYADQDPVLLSVMDSDNIILFDKKIDMRYLIANNRIIITSGATSTLSWLVMSGKPVVFINRREKSPLSDDAYYNLSKGLFIFNDDEDNFHINLKLFLSQPLSEIERLWQEKKVFRENIIREYFSLYSGGAGERAAKVILKEYL